MNKENSSRTTLIAVGAAVLIAIFGIGMAAYALTLDSGENESTSHAEKDTQSHSHESGNKKASAPAAEQASVVIVYGDDGFEQAMYTVKSGETVLVKNESSVDFYFTTGDHHNHDIHSPMNLGTIAPGKSSLFVAPQPGVYGFHNHDYPTQAGELTVQ